MGKAIENIWDKLTEEQKAKALACTTTEEMIALADEEGYKLSDKDVEAMAGGSNAWGCTCTDPMCADCDDHCWSYCPCNS